MLSGPGGTGIRIPPRETMDPATDAPRRPLLALLLTVPVPSLGVLAGMFLWPGTPLGKALFLASKVWFFAFPAIWHRNVDRQPLGFSPARNGGFAAGWLTGLGISAFILAANLLLGDRLLDPALLRERLREVGLGTPGRFLAGALYWIAVNSVLEEYAWRWFCFRQCRALVPERAAVALAALSFTLHHAVALLALVPAGTAALASAGVFSGAVIWSAMFARYRSVWPGYLSHALVDAAIFGIAANVAFG